ncbi:MAG: hypothetical protein Q7S31_01400 [bacterium]|nr:hypothetical protein [bacterium]
MLELPHTLVGAAIATAIPNPYIALPLALASHFVTDYLPHWNPHINTELKSKGMISSKSRLIILLDSGFALMLGTLIAARFLPDVSRFSVIFFACFLAVAPDVAEIPYYFLGMQNVPLIKKLISWQRGHQWNVRPMLGVLTQAIVVIASLIVIFR